MSAGTTSELRTETRPAPLGLPTKLRIVATVLIILLGTSMLYWHMYRKKVAFWGLTRTKRR